MRSGVVADKTKRPLGWITRRPWEVIVIWLDQNSTGPLGESLIRVLHYRR
jgi:hypothetical protein